MDMVARGVPAHRGHDDAGLEDDRRRHHEDPGRLEGHRVERDEEGGVGQARTGDEPLHEGHGGDDHEDRHGRPAAEDQREGQRGDEPEVGTDHRPLDEPARGQDEQPRGQDHVDEGGVATVQGAQPLPYPKGPVVPPVVAPPGRRGIPWVPGPEPLGVEVT